MIETDYDTERFDFGITPVLYGQSIKIMPNKRFFAAKPNKKTILGRYASFFQLMKCVI
jgi:hypothetical protein